MDALAPSDCCNKIFKKIKFLAYKEQKLKEQKYVLNILKLN